MRTLIKPENAAEAGAIRSLLAEHGIAAQVMSFHDTAYDGLFQAQYGWGVVRVAEKDFDRALSIVREWKAAAPQSDAWEDGAGENPDRK